MEMNFTGKPKLSKWIGIALIFCLAMIFYAGYLNGKAFVDDDALYTFYTGENYLTTTVAHGGFPLWMPSVRGGIPFYADIQMGTFYPLNWLLVPFGGGDRLPVGAYQAFIALHVAMAGIFMFLFLRSLKAGDLPAAIGAVTYMFSGIISLHIIHVALFEVFVWIPLALYFVNRYLETGKIKHYLMIVVATLMTFLVGHPQMTLYTAFLLVAYWLFNFVMKEIDGGNKKAGPLIAKALLELAKIAGVYVATVLTGAAAFFPAYQAWSLSPRQKYDYSKIVDESLPPYYLVNLVSGKFFGTQYPDTAANVVNYWGYNKDSWDFQRYGKPYWHFWEFGFYAGQFAFFSIVVSLFNLKKFKNKNAAVFFLLTIGLGLWFALGRYGGLFFLLSKVIPGVGVFRTPARMGGVVDFALAALSGVLIAELAARTKDLDLKRPAIAGGAFYGLFLIVFLLAGKSMAPELRSPAAFGYAAKQILLAAVLYAAFWLAAFAMQSEKLQKQISKDKGAKAVPAAAVTLVLLFVFLDLAGVYGKYHYGTRNPDQFYSDPNGLVPQFVEYEKQAGPFRFGQLMDGKPVPGLMFPENAGYVYRPVELIEGMGIFHYGKYIDFLQITNIPAKLDLCNVLLFLNVDSRTGQGGISANPGALMRAAFFSEFRTYPDHASILKAIESGGLDYHRTMALLASEADPALLAASSPSNEAAVRTTRVSPEHLRIDYATDRPGIIFVSQVNYPGWVATDGTGRRLKIVSAFSAFEGIEIPQAGNGTIELEFKPEILAKSLKVSLVFAILLIGGIVTAFALDKRNTAKQPEK